MRPCATYFISLKLFCVSSLFLRTRVFLLLRQKILHNINPLHHTASSPALPLVCTLCQPHKMCWCFRELQQKQLANSRVLFKTWLKCHCLLFDSEFIIPKQSPSFTPLGSCGDFHVSLFSHGSYNTLFHYTVH